MSTSHLHLPEFFRDWGWPVCSALTSQWTEVNGIKIHSRSSGQFPGIPYLLVHGLIISSLYYIPLAELLAETAEVHAVDLPGFGRSGGVSPTPSISALAEVLQHWTAARNIGACHLVANSMGCQVAALLALRCPSLVRSVTFIGPTIDPAAHSVVRQALRLVHELFHQPVSLLLDLAVDFLRAGPVRSIAMIRKMFADHIEEHLPQISISALIFCGEKDPIAPEDWAIDAERLLPKARRIALPCGHHCVHFTHPRESVAVIRSFTSSVDHEPAL